MGATKANGGDPGPGVSAFERAMLAKADEQTKALWKIRAEVRSLSFVVLVWAVCVLVGALARFGAAVVKDVAEAESAERTVKEMDKAVNDAATKARVR